MDIGVGSRDTTFDTQCNRSPTERLRLLAWGSDYILRQKLCPLNWPHIYIYENSTLCSLI